MEEYNYQTVDAEEKQAEDNEAENKEDAPNGGQRGRGILGRRKQSALG